MLKYAYLIIALVIPTSPFAQTTTTSPPKTKFFIDGNQADILVAKLIDPANYASFGVGGLSPGDMANKASTKKPSSVQMRTKPNATFLKLRDFFEAYNVQ